MKHLNNFLTEVYNNEEQYRLNWQWFVNLITNVKLSRQQLEKMFSNLQDDEVNVWIEETKDSYAGTEDEDAAMALKNYKDLAEFFADYPVIQ